MKSLQTTVGLLGCGNVGAGVARMLIEDKDFINQKMGWPLSLKKIAVRDLNCRRLYPIDPALLTTDPYEIVGNPDIQVVAELMGGIEPARSLVLKAINSGQHVVTANKALLAIHGREIFEAAAANKVEVMFEAAVAGGIPIIRTLKEGLSANKVNRIFGILNGTTNYILTRMTREGLDFQSALAEAQKAGYAEADPTFDIEGFDAAHKLIILTALAYGTLPVLDDIHVEGISRLTPEDIKFAGELGCVIKLLAIAARDENSGRLEVRLHPAMLAADNLMAEVGGAMNAVVVSGHAVGDILLNGAGAGMMPTASSVMADMMELARADRAHSSQRVPALGWCRLTDERPIPMSEVRTPYYLRFTVADKPGVLAAITGIFAERDISIAQVIQKRAVAGEEAVPVVILTHTARECDMMDALKIIDAKKSTLAPTMLIRVEPRL
ncbi:homoserine dehydrogenase [Deltaproteobacteria bacterium OttesenSCG-928-K17]|nr:homoserine dehydrogenase [Deltaproteobacteria bacterium OttesenSCG-928-K17]